MSVTAEIIAEISNVGYLLVLLRMASENGEEHIKTAVLSRLDNLGYTDEGGSVTDPQKRNLKVLINRMMVPRAHDRR
jgi:hypothetical protein